MNEDSIYGTARRGTARRQSDEALSLLLEAHSSPDNHDEAINYEVSNEAIAGRKRVADVDGMIS